MKRRYESSVTRSVKLESEVDKIVRLGQLNISDLVEAGLIGWAHTPGPRQEKLKARVIEIVKEKIAFYTRALSELESLALPPHSCVESAAPASGNYDMGERLSVLNIRSHQYDLVTRSEYERNKDLYQLATAGSWED